MPNSYGFGLRVKLIDLSTNHIVVERSGSIVVNEHSDREFSNFFSPVVPHFFKRGKCRW